MTTAKPPAAQPAPRVHIVTKVALVRDEQGGWLAANSPQSLREQVHDNLRSLGLDVLDMVYLRTGRRR